MPSLSPALREEMVQHLFALPNPRGGIVRGVEQGLSVDEIASQLNTDWNNVNNHVRHHGRMLDGELANSPSSAIKEARVYKVLLGQPLSPALHDYVVDCLQRLQELAPSIRIEPGRLGPMRDGLSLTGEGPKTASGLERGGDDWSQAENEATVSSYLSMLKRELAGESYNKSEERRRLQPRLDGRTEAAVEFKHQNISAVLMGNGWIYIDGYKPMANNQRDLRLEVERQLRADRELDRAMQRYVGTPTDPLKPIVVADMTQVDPPEAVFGTAEWNPRGIKRDYLYQDAKNRQLGLQGELAVIAMEKNRLVEGGRNDLADRVEHVSVALGDGLGYDVHSFELDGADRFIEVKTSVHSPETPFFISSNEVEASAHYGQQFCLYRLFKFGSKSCGWYQLRGPIAETCDLQSKAYAALPLSK
jgi:hypothetical protein